MFTKKQLSLINGTPLKGNEKINEYVSATDEQLEKSLDALIQLGRRIAKTEIEKVKVLAYKKASQP